jgi:hypothetical protein
MNVWALDSQTQSKKKRTRFKLYFFLRALSGLNPAAAGPTQGVHRADSHHSNQSHKQTNKESNPQKDKHAQKNKQRSSRSTRGRPHLAHRQRNSDSSSRGPSSWAASPINPPRLAQPQRPNSSTPSLSRPFLSLHVLSPDGSRVRLGLRPSWAEP